MIAQHMIFHKTITQCFQHLCLMQFNKNTEHNNCTALEIIIDKPWTITNLLFQFFQNIVCKVLTQLRILFFCRTIKIKTGH